MKILMSILLLYSLSCAKTVSEERILECSEFCMKQGFGYDFSFSAKNNDNRGHSDIQFSKCMCVTPKKCDVKI